MIWLPMAAHSLTGHKNCQYKRQHKNIYANYFHMLTRVNYLTRVKKCLSVIVKTLW